MSTGGAKCRPYIAGGVAYRAFFLAFFLAFLLAFGVSSVCGDDLTVTRGRLERDFLLTGELVAEDAELLVVPNANIWPVTVRWLEDDGTEVEAGDVLVEFDSSQLASNLEELERSVLEAANQLASLRATVKGEEIEAELRYERSKAEYKKASLDAEIPVTLVSQQDYEELRLAYQRAALNFSQAEDALALNRTSARARIEKQQVALRKSEMAARRAREGIGLLTLTAPRDGILLVSDNDREGRPFQSGDATWPGLTIGKLPEMSSMIVEAQLFDVDDGAVEAGMLVSATVDAFPEIELRGEIIEVDDIANETSQRSSRRVFRTRIRLEELDLERMRPGMSVKVVAELRLEDVLLIPRASLGWRQEGSAGGVVATLSNGEFESVGIGPCNETMCVLEEGVSEGERLARHRQTTSVAQGDSRR
jgi:HlyD family secretion protein